ncbi:MAG: M12 family metallo-peptidase [Verrucomicrobia bacterium]|nr:M12 family metallo-peptidase [Verrucomicrobiota bacterium]MDA1087028.1 M12 family metallo-peptidase [Verrucomicrobiota bacterium]
MISRNNKRGFKSGSAVATASAAAACALFITSPSQAASEALFEDTEARGRQPRASSPAHVTRTRVARLRADALPTAAAKRGDRVRINLFDGTSVTAELGKLRRRNAKNYTWHGTLAGESGCFSITVYKGTTHGLVRSADGSTYQFKGVAGGDVEIQKLDPAAFAGCDADHGDDVQVGAAGDAGGKAAQDDSPPMESDGGNTLIDVLVAYTPAARAAAGGVDAMEALILSSIDEANAAFQNSAISTEYRLVHSVETTYTESGDSAVDLDRLRATSDGYMDELHTLRDTYGADIVSLFFDMPATCGRAFRMTTLAAWFEEYAFSVVHWDCASANLSFAHETGHLLGSHHAVGDGGLARGGDILYTYSYGWRFNGDGGPEYRTIMAYAPGVRIPYFSNPNVNYDGVATGVSVGDPNEAHNAQSLNNATPTAAAWRSTAVTLDVTPEAPWTPIGAEGEDPANLCQVYTLSNVGSASVTWSVTHDESWLTASATSGSVSVGASVTVTVCVNSAAAALAVGTFNDVLIFSNESQNVTQNRDVALTITGSAGMPFTEDFESGALDGYWSVSGTAEYRTEVTGDDGPYAGSFHMTMDDTAGNATYSRNEATLAVNLTGYSNVVLSFYARDYGDEAQAPPATTFTGGADFDGVAISTDGDNWVEVQPLRSGAISATYAQLQVNLDSILATNGLTYNSVFLIRFNQYDNYAIGSDGIAIDDIQISGSAATVEILATADSNGSLTPGGVVNVATGGDAEFSVQSDPYYHIASLTTNGVGVPGVSGQDSTNFVWQGVSAAGQIDLATAENQTTNGTPEWWLASHGYSNDYESASLSDDDGDGAEAWKEYAAGTDPGDDTSVLELADIAFVIPGQCVVTWQSQPGKTYALTHSTNNLATFEIHSSGIAATPPLNVCTVSVGSARSCFMRVAVETP